MEKIRKTQKQKHWKNTLLLTLFDNRVRGVVLGPGLPHVLGTDELHHGARLVGLVPPVLQPGALWNRDRRNCNFLTSGTGTVTGTGTRYKIMYLISFI
jgi:hypothetical protein